MGSSFQRPTYDKEQISLNIVRLKKGGKNFEIILSDPDGALKIRHGEAGVNIKDVLKSPQIFSDTKSPSGRAELASENEFLSIFGTENTNEIAKKILIEGEFHLTTEQKRVILDKKKAEIINYIHMNAMDPKSGLPHPKQRIELAIEQAHVQINMFESITSQTEQVVKALRPILPLSFEEAHLRITIPSTVASKGYSLLKSSYDVRNEAWLSDGSVMVEILTQAGRKPALFDTINKLTKGGAIITEVKK